MKSIYKYSIDPFTSTMLCGPITKILSVKEQNGKLWVWAEIDTDEDETKVHVVDIGTGWDLEPTVDSDCVLDTHEFLDTVLTAGGYLAHHIYYSFLDEVGIPKSNRRIAEGYCSKWDNVW